MPEHRGKAMSAPNKCRNELQLSPEVPGITAANPDLIINRLFL